LISFIIGSTQTVPAAALSLVAAMANGILAGWGMSKVVLFMINKNKLGTTSLPDLVLDFFFSPTG
jgi:NhaP-type Na+/H+ and K+/H+ antiporter